MTLRKTCDDFREAIMASVIGEVDPATADDVRLHLDACDSCRHLRDVLVEEERLLRSAFDTVTAETGPISRRLIAKLSAQTPSPPQPLAGPPLEADDVMISPDAAQPAVRPDAQVPTGLADGVSRETRPIQQPPTRRHGRRFLAMLKRKPVRWSVAAAAAVAITTVIFPISRISLAPSRPAYALEQTAAVLVGKRALHVKNWSKPGHLKEEFWAEFAPDGRTLRFRQEEASQTTVWQDNVKSRYFPQKNVLMLTRSNGQEDVLERTDPEFTVQHVLELQAKGKATVEICQPSAESADLTVIATYLPDTDGRQLKNVLIVDPQTYIVKRIELWRLTDGTWVADSSLNILEYNQPISPDTFNLQVPDDAAVMDQVNQQVGLPQGDMDLDEHVAELVRRTLDRWQEGDYPAAALLFGGIQPDYLPQHLSDLRPAGGISVAQPVRRGKDNWPFYVVPCRWDVQRDQRIVPIRRIMIVRSEPLWQKVDDQPTRWWVDVSELIKLDVQAAVNPINTDVGLEQGSLSDKQIAARIAREMLEALIAEDFEKAGKLVGGVPAEEMRTRMAGRNRKVLQIISIEEPELHEGESDHYRVTCTAEVQCGDRKEIVQESFSVEPVEGQPGRWEID